MRVNSRLSTSLHWASPSPIYPCKVYPVESGVIWFGQGGLPLRSPYCSILGLVVCHQQPCCQLCRTPRAPDPLPIPLLEVGYHPRHLPLVDRLRVSAGHSEGLADHPHHIIDIGAEFHPVKESCHYFQFYLDQGRLRGSQDPVVRINTFYMGYIFYNLYKHR